MDARKDITKNEFKNRLMELCEYNSEECVATDVTFSFYAYWRSDGDVEYHDTLAKGVKSIVLYIKKKKDTDLFRIFFCWYNYFFLFYLIYKIPKLIERFKIFYIMIFHFKYKCFSRSNFFNKIFISYY